MLPPHAAIIIPATQYRRTQPSYSLCRRAASTRREQECEGRSPSQEHAPGIVAAKRGRTGTVADLTVAILKEIRGELRDLRGDVRELHGDVLELTAGHERKETAVW